MTNQHDDQQNENSAVPQPVTIDEGISVMNIVRAAFFTPMGNMFTDDGAEAWGLPMLFIGRPGSSKTSRFYGFARKYKDVPFESVKPGSRGEGFFGCTPTLGELENGKKVLDFPLPRRFHDKFSKGAGLILIDEALNTPPAVKPAILGFIQERELGEMKFGPRVRIFAAANSVEESPSGYDLSPPEANRMGHMDWPDPPVSDVIGYLTGGGHRHDDEEETLDVAAEEARIMETFYSEHYPMAVGLTAGFLQRMPSRLRVQPKLGDPQASGAWASPRSWEYATRAWASAQVNGLNATEAEAFFSAFLGNAVAHEFHTWRREQDLPSPHDILDGKVKFKHNRQRLDRTAVVLHSCVATLVQAMTSGASNPETKKQALSRASNLWKMMGDIVEDAADLAMPAVDRLARARLIGVPESRSVLASMSSVAGAGKR